jgi:hypothetical protein
MQKLLTILLTTCLTIATHAAANGIDGELLVKVGTTGNKAIPTSQTTNVTISATSKVTDGASAVAFSLNSSNALSTSGAKLLTVGNGGTNVANDSWLVDSDSAATYSGSVKAHTLADVDFPEASVQVFSRGTNGIASQVQIVGSVGSEEVYATGATGVLFDIWPSAGATATAYTYDTSRTHTSGNLVEVKNNTTNVATIAYNGSLTVHDIVGVTDASDAPAGSVGQYVSSLVASGAAVSLVSGTPKTMTSISLTAGDWGLDQRLHQHALYSCAGRHLLRSRWHLQ